MFSKNILDWTAKQCIPISASIHEIFLYVLIYNPSPKISMVLWPASYMLSRNLPVFFWLI